MKIANAPRLSPVFLSAIRAVSTSATINRSFPGPVTSGAEKALMLTPAAPSTAATSASTPGLLCPLTTNCVVVGDGEGFATNAGLIGLYAEGEKLKFEVNQEAAHRAGLRLSSQLLKLARLVRDEQGEGR